MRRLNALNWLTYCKCLVDLRLLKHYIYWLTYCKCLVDLKLLKQIVDKVKAALDTAVGILSDKDGWKVNLYLSHFFSMFTHQLVAKLRINFYKLRKIFFFNLNQGWEGERRRDHQKQEKCRREKGEIEYLSLTFPQNWHFSGLALWSGHPSACKQALGKVAGF